MSIWPIRMKLDPDRELRRFEPLDPIHPGVAEVCPGCGDLFDVGDVTTLVPIGPGPEPDDQAKARAGGWFTGAGALVHWSCATGEAAPNQRIDR